MKNNLALLLAALCCAPLFSQNTTTWFVPGCQWKYQYESLTGPGELTYTYVGTEMKGGELCTKLHQQGYHQGFPPGPSNGGFHYFFARNDSVFYWENNHFRLLYDFTRQEGDTIHPLTGPYEYGVVEATGNVNFGGEIPVRYQDIRLVNYSILKDTLVTFTRVYERIGGRHLIFWDIESPITEIQYYLSCYRDDDYPQMDCDLTYDFQYVPFPNFGTASWSEETTSWCYFDGYQYKIEGDSVIWGIGQGRKVYARPTYSGIHPCPTSQAQVFNEPFKLIGLLDQSTAYKKVYFTRLAADYSLFPPCLGFSEDPFPFEKTTLLYDFDLEVGDTVQWRPEPNIVLFTDSIQLNDGSWRRTFHFKEDSSYYWAEGIGSNWGLFNSRAYNFTDMTCILNCFRENNILKYSRVNAAFCDSVLVSTGEAPPLEKLVRLVPNPTSGQVLFELPDDAVPAMLRLFDAQGKLLATREITAPQTWLDVSPWRASAVLFLQIQSADGRQAGKILRVE
jgi:hypothetical protein